MDVFVSLCSAVSSVVMSWCSLLTSVLVLVGSRNTCCTAQDGMQKATDSHWRVSSVFMHVQFVRAFTVVHWWTWFDVASCDAYVCAYICKWDMIVLTYSVWHTYLQVLLPWEHTPAFHGVVDMNIMRARFLIAITACQLRDTYYILFTVQVSTVKVAPWADSTTPNYRWSLASGVGHIY